MPRRPASQRGNETNIPEMTLPDPDQFTSLVIEMLGEPFLSYRAKGILAVVLAGAEPGAQREVEVTRAWLDTYGTEGRDAITTALAELKAAGLCKAARRHVIDGRCQGSALVFGDFQDQRGAH